MGPFPIKRGRYSRKWFPTLSLSLAGINEMLQTDIAVIIPRKIKDKKTFYFHKKLSVRITPGWRKIPSREITFRITLICIMLHLLNNSRFSPNESCADCIDTLDNITTLNVPAISAYYQVGLMP